MALVDIYPMFHFREAKPPSPPDLQKPDTASKPYRVTEPSDVFLRQKNSRGSGGWWDWA